MREQAFRKHPGLTRLEHSTTKSHILYVVERALCYFVCIEERSLLPRGYTLSPCDPKSLHLAPPTQKNGAREIPSTAQKQDEDLMHTRKCLAPKARQNPPRQEEAPEGQRSPVEPGSATWDCWSASRPCTALPSRRTSPPRGDRTGPWSRGGGDCGRPPLERLPRWVPTLPANRRPDTARDSQKKNRG